MQITVSRQTSFSINDLPRAVLEHVMDRLTFPNPVYQEAEKRGFSTGKISPVIHGYEFTKSQVFVPRGFTRQLLLILSKAGLPCQVNDLRRQLPEVVFNFTGHLHPFQKEAVAKVNSRDFGVLTAPTGSGKTVMALALIAARRQPALIIVHNRELLEQWISRIETFLGIPAQEVGIIGGGKRRIGERITVALVQSLYKVAHEVAPHIGFLVGDECHRCPSRTFTEAVSAFDCRYMLGLSATPWRRDRLNRLIWWYLGDKVHEIETTALLDSGHILPAEVVWRKTAFQPEADPSEEYSRMLSELTEDAVRNGLIVRDVARETQNSDGVCLVLTDRKGHAVELVQRLTRKGIEVALLTGDLSMGKRQEAVAAVNTGQAKVLVATGQLIGEGFDCRQLSTLFLATPIKFSGRLIQYLGRVLRPAPGKDRARVYDYLDPVGVLEASARARGRVYENQPPV